MSQKSDILERACQPCWPVDASPAKPPLREVRKLPQDLALALSKPGMAQPLEPVLMHRDMISSVHENVK